MSRINMRAAEASGDKYILCVRSRVSWSLFISLKISIIRSKASLLFLLEKTFHVCLRCLFPLLFFTLFILIIFSQHFLGIVQFTAIKSSVFCVSASFFHEKVKELRCDVMCSIVKSCRTQSHFIQVIPS